MYPHTYTFPAIKGWFKSCQDIPWPIPEDLGVPQAHSSAAPGSRRWPSVLSPPAPATGASSAPGRPLATPNSRSAPAPPRTRPPTTGALAARAPTASPASPCAPESAESGACAKSGREASSKAAARIRVRARTNASTEGMLNAKHAYERQG